MGKPGPACFRELPIASAVCNFVLQIGDGFLSPLEMDLIRLEMRKWKQIRIDEILVGNSSLVSGLSEASGARLSWVEVSQESVNMS